MSRASRKDITRTVLFSAWGLFTLLLFCSVVLLLRELTERDPTSPLVTFAESVQVAETSFTETEAVQVREINLYFGGLVPHTLAPERYALEVTDSSAQNFRQVIEQLIEGPQEDNIPVFSPRTRVRGVYLKGDGELIVDFSRGLERPAATGLAGEALMRDSLLRTLAQPGIVGRDGKSIDRLRILMEGSPLADNFGEHLSFRDAIALDDAASFRSEDVNE